MNEVIRFLRSFGLTTTEISLYLNGLRYQTVSVAKLVELSSVKRTTAYHALSTLVEKGLASQAKQDGKLVYKMTPADQLSTLLNGRKEQLETQIDNLNQLTPQFPTLTSHYEVTPEVTNYYGLQGVHAAVDRALYCKTKQWRIIAPKDNFFRNSESTYIKYFMKTRSDKNIQAVSLWESADTVNIVNDQVIKTRSPRILPVTMHGKFKSTIIIFDESILIISSFNKKMATTITGKEASDTLKLMFDTIWESSSPLLG